MKNNLGWQMHDDKQQQQAAAATAAVCPQKHVH